MIETVKKIFNYSIDHYSIIDEMPIYNWFRLHETNDIRWCLKTLMPVNVKQIKILEAAFKSMNDEFIDTFGVNDEHKKALELKKEIQILKIKMALEHDNSLLTFIEIKEFELKRFLSESQAGDTGNVSAHVEKYMGFKLDQKKVSVKEFYGYVELIKKESSKPRK